MNQASESNPIIQFENVFFRYFKEKPILNQINLSIFKGEIIFLGGPSGSGKSTLVNLLSGQIPFHISGLISGKVHFEGKLVWEHTPESLSQKIGYMFQNAEEQLVTFTVFDEIAFAAENLRISPEEIKKKVTDLAKELSITHLLSRSIHHLSGGEKQKVVLASNIIMEPDILILDEPLAFLDSNGEQELIKSLENLHHKHSSMIIIVIEHRFTPFSRIIDRILLLNHHGEIEIDERKTDGQFPRELVSSLRITKNQNSKNLVCGTASNNLLDTSPNPSQPDSDQKTPLITLKEISFGYSEDEEIFSHFSLNIFANEFIGLYGSNGSGKTSLFLLIAQILNPQKGRIEYHFEREAENAEKKELNIYPRIGFIFQNPENQLFETTIIEEIAYGPKNFGQFPKNQDPYEHYNEFLELINEKRTSHDILAQENPFKLSWGQKRRLNLGSIFSYAPDLLLIDEPFIGQDKLSIQNIMEIINKFHQKGKTVIIISHDWGLLEQYCTRIVNLDQLKNQNRQEKPIMPVSSDSASIPNLSDNSQLNENEKSSILKSQRKEKKITQLKKSINLEIQPSWLASIHPLAKFTSILLLTIYLFIINSIILYGVIFGCLIAIASANNIPPKQLLHKIRWMIYLTIIYVPLNAIFDAEINPNDEILFFLFTNTLPIRRLALYYALRTGLLILNLFTSTFLFTLTTSMKDFVYALVQSKIPYRFAFSFMIGLRYVPLIEQDASTIEMAQRLRGSQLNKKTNPRDVLHHLTNRIGTLLFSLLRKTKTTASAIDARGFGAFKTRTSCYIVKWARKDILFILGSILIFSVMIANTIFNWIEWPSLYQLYLNIL